MKKLSILAAMLMATGFAANAQTYVPANTGSVPTGPTNNDTRSTRGVSAISAPATTNAAAATQGGVDGAGSAGPFSPNTSLYRQDSYIEQPGSRNVANVNQTDNRAGSNSGPSVNTGAGSSAILRQVGDDNIANQTQTLGASAPTTGARNLERALQEGKSSRIDQTQTDGTGNIAYAEQMTGTLNNRAIQTQAGGSANSAKINQSNAGGFPAASGNRAEQYQAGTNQTAVLNQQGASDYAKQTQGSGSGNEAYIGQGAPGVRNTAIQEQNGTDNKASITQSVGSPINTYSSDTYALQRQAGTTNSANIDQRGNSSYAQQDQLTTSNLNNSLITQQGGPNAAYTVQTGTSNNATVTQK